MHHLHFNVITRRSFLDRSAKTSLAVALSTLTDIPLVMKQALAEGSIGLNGKKLLFIWLRGANDGLNSVVPTPPAGPRWPSPRTPPPTTRWAGPPISRRPARAPPTGAIPSASVSATASPRSIPRSNSWPRSTTPEISP